MNSLVNFKNYYIYANMVQFSNKMVIYVPNDININNIDDHIEGITNILKDGIETYFVHNTKITISWGGDLECDLSLVDYWFTLFMWSMILKTNQKIQPCNIFWQAELKRFNIKDYIDAYIANKQNQVNIDSLELNNIICEGLSNYSSIEQFSGYLANTINNEDDIDLMNKCPEFNDILHCSMAGVPIEDVKDTGMEITYRAIDIIKDSKRYIGYEHGLTNSFRASEAINPRQYKEASINIGTKPNNNGGVYPYIINKSFKTGGVNDPLSLFIEASTGRTAQILSKNNVGDSGDFARLLGINNTDTILNIDKNYECMSQHFIKFEIKTKKHLSMIKNRYYRYNPIGMEHLINDKDLSLIGKTIYMRSPMTCASKSSGHGICKRCYGDLYYTNRNINVGKIAAELLSAQLTQTLLSAKHLLETKIIKINWNPEFYDWFNIDTNVIMLNEDNIEESYLKKCILIIDPEDIVLTDESDDYNSSDDDDDIILDDSIGSYNEYITKFTIRTPEGANIEFGSTESDSMYLSTELNNIIRRKAYNTDNMINVSLSVLTGIVLFYIKINNNEISKTMNDIINIINKSSVTSALTKDEALQRLVDLIVEGGLSVDSVHLEEILSNQIVKPDDILKRPNWNDPNAKYRMFTLNQALTNNPSIIISLLYKDLHKVLYNPLSYAKNAPSFFDLFFCEDPQNYMSDDLLTESTMIEDLEKGIEMVKIVK